ncbi:MAG: hypothetical protein PHV27_11720 [Mesotoga sp.]|uniref:hypothetical protein n=1 Tax=Mesotoga sp. TaxID=2053577 RepID=UPI0026373742|nr:hypothetical protein [Mesotoga sp.]MDD4826912.1 hypothetical protein [Mesotoga sp.]
MRNESVFGLICFTSFAVGNEDERSRLYDLRDPMVLSLQSVANGSHLKKSGGEPWKKSTVLGEGFFS